MKPNKLYKRIHLALLPIALMLVMVACGPAASTPAPIAGPTSAASSGTIDIVTPEAEADPEPEESSETPGASIPTITNSTGGTGRLVLYTTRSESLIKPVIDAFKKAQPGVDVVLLTGQNAQLAAKMLEERGNPQADVFINTDTISMSSLAAQGLFAPNSSQAVRSVQEAYRAEDGSWVALTLRARVIMYNTNLVKEAELPKTMHDLTDPKWRGQVGSADSTNGSIQGQVVAMRSLEGEARTEEFLRGLVANETQFFGGHTDVRKAVGAGELKLGLVNHYYYQLSKAEGAPVGVVYPDQEASQMGLLVNSTNAGILKGGQNPAAAQTFVDYLLTPDGQQVFARLNYEYPIVKGVALADGVQPLENYRLAPINLKTLYAELKPASDLMKKAGIP